MGHRGKSFDLLTLKLGERTGGRSLTEIRATIQSAVFVYTAALREAQTNKDLAGLAALEVPDILAEFYQLEAFQWRHLPWPGSLSDQPHLLMFELDCVDQALKLQKTLEEQQAAAVAAAEASQPRVTL